MNSAVYITVRHGIYAKAAMQRNKSGLRTPRTVLNRAIWYGMIVPFKHFVVLTTHF